MNTKFAAEMVRAYVAKANDHDLATLFGSMVWANNDAPIVIQAPVGVAPLATIKRRAQRRRTAAKKVSTKVVAKAKRPAVKRAPRAVARGARVSSEERVSMRDRVIAHVSASHGLAASDVARTLGLTLAQAKAAIGWAIVHGKLAMGGERRFARYAGTMDVAMAASKAARNPGASATAAPVSGTTERTGAKLRSVA